MIGHSAEYTAYLASGEWRARRAQWLQWHRNRVCKACGVGKFIDVHHMTYARLGAELDTDLCSLCRWCHDTAHALAHGRGITIRAATMLLVAGLERRPNIGDSKLRMRSIGGGGVPGSVRCVEPQGCRCEGPTTVETWPEGKICRSVQSRACTGLWWPLTKLIPKSSGSRTVKVCTLDCINRPHTCIDCG